MDEETGRSERPWGGLSVIPDAELFELDRHAALGGLMGSIAHETLNPLAAAINLALLAGELLRARPEAQPGAGEVVKHLEDLAGEIRRACSILSRIQEFFRAGELGWTPYDLERAAEEMLALAGPRTKLSRVPLEVRLSGRLPAVRCRPALVRQAVLGFLLHAGPGPDARGGISLSTGLTDEGRAAFIEVRGSWDRGAAAELAAEAAHRIARVHGGRIEAEGGPGEHGFRRLVLPIQDDAHEEALGNPGSRR